MQRMRTFTLLILLLFFSYSCTNKQIEQSSSKEEILPIKVILEGQLEEVHDSGPLTPDIHFDINKQQVTMTVGATETYTIPYDSTTLNEVFSQFELKDIKSNEHFYIPSFKYMSHLKTIKNVEGIEYSRKFSNYQRQDIPIVYFAVTQAEKVKFTLLSHTLNEIAINLLQEEIEYGSWFTATSMEEALTKPERIYKLILRNSRATELPPAVGRLTNLKVLNISNTRIRSLPKEIGNCVYLKTLVANNSQLAEIPSSIGNLKEIRFINFGSCKIQNLPEEFGQLTSLWFLNISDNQLRDLPESMSNLKNLQFFSMAENKFNSFPNEVVGMASVGNLWMHNNNFRRIPRDIGKLKELHHFLVDKMEIENLSEIESLLPDVRIIDEANRRK